MRVGPEERAVAAIVARQGVGSGGGGRFMEGTRLKGRVARLTTGCLAVAAFGLAPAAAEAQYTAPPPDPGFTYIFDGSDREASFDQWKFAAGTFAQSNQHRTSAARPAARAGDAEPDQWRVRRRRLAVRRVLVPGEAVRRRRVPDPVHGPEHADVDAQRRRDDPLARDPLQLPGPGQSDRPARSDARPPTATRRRSR